MQRLGTFDAGVVTLLLATSFTIHHPSLAAVQPKLSGAVAATIVAQKPAQVNLNLMVEKQLLKQDSQGNKLVSWIPLQGSVIVQPGDILRYRFSGKNVSDRGVKNLAVTQPVPRQMVYLLNSAESNSNTPAKLTYSIDNGKTFEVNPTIQVKLASGAVQKQPAPPSAYTHIRWTFQQVILPGSDVTGSFQVRVR